MENDSRDAKRPRVESGPPLVTDDAFAEINPLDYHITVEIQRKMNVNTYAAILQSTSLKQIMIRVVFVYFKAISPEDSAHIRRTYRLPYIYNMAVRYFTSHQLLTREELLRLRQKMLELLNLHIISSQTTNMTPS